MCPSRDNKKRLTIVSAKSAEYEKTFQSISLVTTTSQAVVRLLKSKKTLVFNSYITFLLNIIFVGQKDPCGSFTCPFNERCIINSYGTPECICKDACQEGDDLTSVVCGRDGVEYPNLCALKMKSCKGPQIKVNRFGTCKPREYLQTNI